MPEEPDSRAVRTRRNTIALVALGGTVLAIALVSIVVVLWSMTTPTAEPHRSQQPVASPSVAVSAAPPPPASAPSSASSRWASAQGPTVVPDGAKACSATIAVPASSTSCEFAAAVAAVVATVDPTSINFQVTAHSPVTQQDYVMTCVRNPALTTCTGGTNATVWIRNGG